MFAHSHTTPTRTSQSQREGSFPRLSFRSGLVFPDHESVQHSRKGPLFSAACHRESLCPPRRARGTLCVLLSPVAWVSLVCFPAAFRSRRCTELLVLPQEIKYCNLFESSTVYMPRCTQCRVCPNEHVAAAIVTQGDSERGPVAHQNRTCGSGHTSAGYVYPTPCRTLVR